MNTAPENSNKSVLGIPVAKYAMICYVLILMSAGFGVVSSILALIGMTIPYGGIFVLMGFVGIALCVTGFVVFSEDFADVDMSHFKFLAAVYVAFFLLFVIFSNALAGFGAVGYILTLALVAFQFAVLFAGYRVWQSGYEATVATVKTQLISLKNQISKKAPENTEHIVDEAPKDKKDSDTDLGA